LVEAAHQLKELGDISEVYAVVKRQVGTGPFVAAGRALRMYGKVSGALACSHIPSNTLKEN